jgi:hypothetical protein
VERPRDNGQRGRERQDARARRRATSAAEEQPRERRDKQHEPGRAHQCRQPRRDTGGRGGAKIARLVVRQHAVEREDDQRRVQRLRPEKVRERDERGVERDERGRREGRALAEPATSQPPHEPRRGHGEERLQDANSAWAAPRRAKPERHEPLVTGRAPRYRILPRRDPAAEVEELRLVEARRKVGEVDRERDLEQAGHEQDEPELPAQIRPRT